MFEVSIIMPIYNVAEHLPRAIESALAQKNGVCEIILVNDGSTDASGVICDTYAEKEPLIITVIHQENQGAGPARNTGLKAATGRYIYFADPDDYFEPLLIADNLKLAHEKDSDVVIFGYTQESAGKPKDREEFLPNIPQLLNKEAIRNHFRNVYHFTPYALWNKFYKKEYLEKNALQFTNQEIGEDALFNIEVLKHIESIAVNRQAYYHYVTHVGSAVNRYRPNRLEMELTVAKQFENMLEQWGKAVEFTDLIAEEYFHVLYLETANIVREGCQLTLQKKTERLKKLWQTINIKIIGHKAVEKNPFRRALLNNFVNDKPENALRLMKARNKAADSYGKAFNRLKQFFRT